MGWLQDFLSSLLSGIWGYVVAGAGIVASALGLYLKGRSDAKRKALLDDYETASEIRDRVRKRKDDTVRKYDDAGWRE